MVARVPLPNKTRNPSDSSGGIEQTLFTTLQALVGRAVIVGSGDPESVVEARQGALYMDESASAGDVLYVKRLADIGGDKTQGWRAV